MQQTVAYFKENSQQNVITFNKQSMFIPLRHSAVLICRDNDLVDKGD